MIDDKCSMDSLLTLARAIAGDLDMTACCEDQDVEAECINICKFGLLSNDEILESKENLMTCSTEVEKVKECYKQAISE